MSMCSAFPCEASISKRLLASLVLAVALPLFAQSPTVHLKIHAVLVDRDLNQKPVPRLALQIRNVAILSAEPIKTRTNLEGIGEVDLPAGRYEITTPDGVEFQGKRYTWKLEVALESAPLTLELSNDNAATTAAPVPSTGEGGELTPLFQRLKNAVVTVRSERGDGSGFLVDSAGLFVTNHHVIADSNYLAVQFDAGHKVTAELIADDADNDVAIIRANLAAFPGAVVVTLANVDERPLAVGEQVFTISSPFFREKTLTTGVVSKIEPREITSDTNINPGSSGGPLFNFRGGVVAVAVGGQGKLARFIPIRNAAHVIEQGRAAAAGKSALSAELLPVEPADKFPAAPLEAMLLVDKLDDRPYFFEAGEYRVAVLPPQVRYYDSHAEEIRTQRQKAKREKGDSNAAMFSPETLADAKEYEPVVFIQVLPKFGGVFRLRYKSEFLRMRLLCGGREVIPIDRGRTTRTLRDLRGKAADTAYQGLYKYSPDAIAPSCGQMTLEIYSDKAPEPFSFPLSSETAGLVWSDLAPYRSLHPKP
jgi:S1-C subfamily serine protease